MVFGISEEPKLSIVQSSLAGGIAGAVTRALAQPLDVVKIRLQLQLEPIKNGTNSKYRSVLQTVSSIIKEEGIATLWSGHLPAQYLSISYGVVQFSIFEKLTQIFEITDQKFYVNNKHWINFTNGSVAATVATVVSFPFDTIRTRLIAEQKTQKAYKGFVNAFSTMLKTEGASSLYKGLIPTLGQIAPHAGIQFTVYKLFTNNILNRIDYLQRQTSGTGVVRSSLLANLLAGSVAGLVAKTAIYPFDLVKKRLQIQGFQEHRISFGKQMYCQGLLHCFKLTIVNEGFMALYKGYLPSTYKAVIVSALHFAIYDEVKHLLLSTQR